MSSAAPAILELAHELRRLRAERWPDARGLTQATLARVLGGEEPLSPATVASWENKTAPKLPPRERVLAYAQFFATRRSMEPTPHLIGPDSFTPDEEAEYTKLREKLLRLHGAARGTDEPAIARRSWRFTDAEKVTLFCAELPEEERPALARPDSPNYTELLSFADLDAMVELYAYLHEENSPSPKVKFKVTPKAGHDDLSGHVVIIGGIGWNDLARRTFLDLPELPVRQEEDSAVPFGEVFVTKIDGLEQRYLPQWAKTEPPELIEDVGLLVRMPNPNNSKRTLTMCNGIHSRGVLGAVRSLTDVELRESNERYIAENLPGEQFGILMRVKVIKGHALTPDFSNPRTVLHQWSKQA